MEHVYTNEVPWAGLGATVDPRTSVRSMLKAANLDWQVERRPLYIEADNSGLSRETVEGFSALMANDKLLDIVGSKYQPVQNEKVFTFFRDFCAAGKAKITALGALRGGRVVWGLADLGESFTLNKNDKVTASFLCLSPHQQGKSLIFKLNTIRGLCSNTIPRRLAEAGVPEYRLSHRTKLTSERLDTARATLNAARNEFDAFEQAARRLSRRKLDRAERVAILQPIFQPQDDLSTGNNADLNRVMSAILAADDNAPGADPKTAWGLLNAVSYYADHVASRTPDKRLTNAWLGKTATQKEKVLHALLAA